VSFVLLYAFVGLLVNACTRDPENVPPLGTRKTAHR
jgi:hypothetical protein